MSTDAVLQDGSTQSRIPLSNDTGKRYDEYLGLLGSSNDLRSRLLLDFFFNVSGITNDYVNVNFGEILDVDLNKSNSNFNRTYWGDGSDAFLKGTCDLHPEAEGYIRAIIGFLDRNTGYTDGEKTAILESITNIKNNLSAEPTNAVALKMKRFVNDFLNVNFDREEFTTPTRTSNKLEFLLVETGINTTLCNLTPIVSDRSEIPRGTKFNFFITDKFALEQFLDATTNQGKKLSSPEIKEDNELENIYVREVGDTNKIFMIKGKNKVEVQPGSQYFTDMMKNDGTNCYGTGLVGGKDAVSKCNQYFTKCLSGKDINECKTFMQTADFWKNAITAVENMTPTVMLQTINTFKFNSVMAVTPEGQKYKKFVKSSEWLTNLAKTLGEKEDSKVITDIRNNTQLLGYLDAIVAKLNKNPGIANPTYVKGKVAVDLDAFTNTNLYSYNLRPKALMVMPGSVVYPSPSSIMQLSDKTLSHHNTLGQYYHGLPFLPFVSGNMLAYTGMMYGGADENIVSNRVLPLQAAGEISNIYQSILSSLESEGKELNINDKTEFNNDLEELNVLEEKMLKADGYTEGYINLVNIQQGGNLIKDKNIPKFVNKRNNYHEKLTSKYTDIYSKLSKLSVECSKQIDNKNIITVNAYPESF